MDIKGGIDNPLILENNISWEKAQLLWIVNCQEKNKAFITRYWKKRKEKEIKQQAHVVDCSQESTLVKNELDIGRLKRINK